MSRRVYNDTIDHDIMIVTFVLYGGCVHVTFFLATVMVCYTTQSRVKCGFVRFYTQYQHGNTYYVGHGWLKRSSMSFISTGGTASSVALIVRRYI